MPFMDKPQEFFLHTYTEKPSILRSLLTFNFYLLSSPPLTEAYFMYSFI